MDKESSVLSVFNCFSNCIRDFYLQHRGNMTYWVTPRAAEELIDVHILLIGSSVKLLCRVQLFLTPSFFFFKFYNIVLVLPNIEINLPQVYMCSPSWTLLPLPCPYPPSGSSQCTSPKHPGSCIEPGLATRFIHDILHVSMPYIFIS